jgi:hypothetical protein
VPDGLKLGRITVHKKGDKQLVTNYHPISLLSVYHKTLEKLMYSRLRSFFLKINHILYDFQFGFRANHYTSLALLEVIDNIYNQIIYTITLTIKII